MDSSWVDALIVVAAMVLALLVAYGVAYWAQRAQTDRSAMVGLYLLFGIPGTLLTILGLAWLTGGKASGWTWLLTGLGLLLPLFRPVRRGLARFTPLDPLSAIDMTGLCILIGIIGFLASTYGNDPAPDQVGEVSVSQLAAQFVFLIALAFIAVGIRLWRNPREAVERLGLVMPSGRDLAFGVGALVGAFALTIAAGVLTTQFQPEVSTEINQVTGDITSNVNGVLAAVLFGLGSGASEELLLRGALLPRYGIVLTAILFALLHSQYGVSFVLLGVFAIGVLLGFLRTRTNTTTAILVHALFNMIAVLASTRA